MKKMHLLALLGIALLCAPLLGRTALAQESDAKLIDEVIARVNTGVIMRSSYDAALREVLEELKKQNLKPEELEKQFGEWKVRVLDELINTQLLAQRAKDLSINVDADVNQQLLRLMKDNNCESIECLGQKMREAGYDIEDVRRNLTEQYSKQRVISNEVYMKLFRNITEKERRDFYEKNKQYFTEPAEVTLSNIFIPFGKDSVQALVKIKEIATQAKSGAVDFATLAEKYSETENGKKSKGLLGSFKLSDLAPEVKAAVENAAAGTITDPVKLDTGFALFRVDTRKDSKAVAFEDERVQGAISEALVKEGSEKQIDEYLGRLRNDAFIEIDPRYQFEASKVKSAQIRHTPYSEDNAKKKKKEKKEKEKEQKEADKATANNKQ